MTDDNTTGVECNLLSYIHLSGNSLAFESVPRGTTSNNRDINY